MPGMDVFNADGFTMRELTVAFLEMDHAPMRIGAMGLFQSAGVRTTSISVEKRGNSLALVPTTPRGGPGTQIAKENRDLVSFETSRIAVDAAINADEVQNIRAFGSESLQQTLQSEVNDRAAQVAPRIDVTEEFQRMGALKGIVLDSDLSEIVNLFDAFNVAAQSEVGLNIAAVAENGLRAAISSNIIRPIEDELGGVPYQGIHAMCSGEFMDDLFSHPDVVNRLKNFQQGAQELAGSIARTTLDFGGVVWEEYRGSVGGTAYVAADKAHAFPVGVPNQYVSRYAPAEYWDTVGTVGLPRYVRMNPDGNDSDHTRTIRVQSQAIHMCTRPRTLMPLRRGA